MLLKEKASCSISLPGISAGPERSTTKTGGYTMGKSITPDEYFAKREKEKILKFRERYGGICDMDSYSECAKIMEASDTGLSLTRITTDGTEQGTVVQRNITEYEESDSQDIWKWYFNQRGGSCNGS
jgi:hypothetical protein